MYMMVNEDVMLLGGKKVKFQLSYLPFEKMLSRNLGETLREQKCACCCGFPVKFLVFDTLDVAASLFSAVFLPTDGGRRVINILALQIIQWLNWGVSERSYFSTQLFKCHHPRSQVKRVKILFAVVFF